MKSIRKICLCTGFMMLLLTAGISTDRAGWLAGWLASAVALLWVGGAMKNDSR